jgi:hypothetical protein
MISNLNDSSPSDDLSICEELFMQSDERGAVGFDLVVKLAADILENSFSWKSHVNNKQRNWYKTTCRLGHPSHTIR